MTAARHINAWHEDFGPVLWWTRPVKEAPFCGCPGDSDWPGYHRWWTPLPPLPTRYTPTPKGQFAPNPRQPQGERP
jgi:hypothetical protein